DRNVTGVQTCALPIFEVAMKMAVQYWLNRGDRSRNRFIAFKGGYHGDTTGAMAVCDPALGMHALFHGLLPEHFIVELPVNEESRSEERRVGKECRTR